jgi:hypothetical protein
LVFSSPSGWFLDFSTSLGKLFTSLISL